MKTNPGDSISRNGITDTVFREGDWKPCLWVRNHGEQLIVSVDWGFTDEELVGAFTAYIRWRRQHPLPPREEE